MRIAIVAEVFLPKIDGVVNRTMNLIRELNRCHDEVMVLCAEAKGCTGCPVPVAEFPSFSFPLYPEYQIGLPDKRLLRVVQQFAPDVLHYINPFAFGFRCYDLLQKAGIRIPSVFSFHSLYGEFVKQYPLLRPLSHLLWWLMREYHNRADTNMTVSRVMQTELVKRGFKRVQYWPPAVDTQLFHPARKNSAMRDLLTHGHSEKHLLLTVSRLAPEKNVGFLAKVLEHCPNSCLAIVGDGPQRAELEDHFAGKNTNFVGYLKGVQLAEAYASADAFIYASETETMGNVVLEAMASGCAVIAPNAGGIPSLVEHARTGMLYSPGNLGEAVRHTRMVLADSDFLSRLCRSARAEVEGWNWASSVDQVRQVYQVAIQEYQPAALKLSWSQRLAQGVAFALVSGFGAMAKTRQQSRKDPKPALRGSVGTGSGFAKVPSSRVIEPGARSNRERFAGARFQPARKTPATLWQ
jgi:glycosyltransferase involved in cell wall biosynthesis